MGTEALDQYSDEPFTPIPSDHHVAMIKFVLTKGTGKELGGLMLGNPRGQLITYEFVNDPVTNRLSQRATFQIIEKLMIVGIVTEFSRT